MIILVYLFSTFPTLPAPSLISGIYGGVCTSQNGRDKGQHMATRGSRIRECPMSTPMPWWTIPSLDPVEPSPLSFHTQLTG